MGKQSGFRKLCYAHDLTYQYSDDSESWRRGQASEAAIKEAAKDLPAGKAAEIWNQVVDKKISEDSRPQFYWKGE